VSPLWRDEIAIYLAPRKIALARRERGLRPRVSAATEVAVPEGRIGDTAPAFSRLAEVLAEPTWQNAMARIVIADPWVRFGLVPAPMQRLDSEGRRAHARYVLADTYGEALKDWNIVIQDGPPDLAAVVCAMPGDLKPALEAVLAPAQLTMVSLQPQLVVAFNAWRDRLPRTESWFVSLEDGWLSAVHVANGAWDRVHMARLSGDWTVELERLQAFGRLTRAAEGGGRMFVSAPVWMRERGQSLGAELEWLESASPEGGPAQELVELMRGNA